MTAQRWYAVEHHSHGKGRWQRHPRRHPSKEHAKAWARRQGLITREEAMAGKRGGVYRIIPIEHENQEAAA